MRGVYLGAGRLETSTQGIDAIGVAGWRPVVRTWTVSSRGLPSAQVQAVNWVVALGLALERMWRAGSLQRLACELLPNGTVIARDVSAGTGFVVQAADGPAVTGGEEQAPMMSADDLIEVTADKTGGTQYDPIYQAETPVAAGQIALLLAREAVPAESGAVILEDKGFLRFVSVLGPHARKLAGVRLPVGVGVAWRAMQERREIVLSDVRDDPSHCAEVDAITGYRTQAIAVVPILDGARCFGVLELMNFPPSQPLEEDDLYALRRVADALATRLARG